MLIEQYIAETWPEKIPANVTKKQKIILFNALEYLMWEHHALNGCSMTYNARLLKILDLRRKYGIQDTQWDDLNRFEKKFVLTRTNLFGKEKYENNRF